MDSDNWVVSNLQGALDTWNEKMGEIVGLLTASPADFRGGGIWDAVLSIHGAVQAMDAAGFASAAPAALPGEMVEAIEDVGFLDAIPLWAVTLLGGLLVTVLSFIMILAVYGRFFKIYMYTALAPIPLSTFAGEPSQSVGKAFLKSYGAVCLEGAVILLACVIFSLFASAPPVVDAEAPVVTQVWSYVGELAFNMLVLTGMVKMADRVVREMMGL